MYYKNTIKNKKLAYVINNTDAGKSYSSWEIKDSQRVKARSAWEFAQTNNTPLEAHLHCQVPQGLMPFDTVLFYREIAQKLRVFCKSIGIDCLMIMTRQSDHVTNANEVVNFLIYIPTSQYLHFCHLVKGWRHNITVSKVNYQKTIQPDGKIDSIFNKLFMAASNESVNKDPTILHQLSGRITGTRVMVSQKLCNKKNIKLTTASVSSLGPVTSNVIPPNVTTVN